VLSFSKNQHLRTHYLPDKRKDNWKWQITSLLIQTLQTAAMQMNAHFFSF